MMLNSWWGLSSVESIVHLVRISVKVDSRDIVFAVVVLRTADLSVLDPLLDKHLDAAVARRCLWLPI